MLYYEKFCFNVKGFFFIISGLETCYKCGLKVLEIIGKGDQEVEADTDGVKTISGEEVELAKPELVCHFCGKRIE